MATDLLCQRYIQNRYIPPKDDWPPYHPKHYTPLTIIHHKGRRTETEVTNVAQEMVVNSVAVYGRTINSVSELFSPFEGATPRPFLILIEGAPGIGKTILSKEIALQWANHTILHNTKLLFLIFLSDPEVKNIDDSRSLVNIFCEGNELVSKITDWLVESHGKYVTIVLDGYDEVSKDSDSSFINDIVSRRRLTKCSLVITSRPSASSHLHNIVDCRAEVLGFTEEDRLAFVQSAFGDQSEKIEKLKSFLQSNPFLNTLCYIPLNMSILLCLTEDDIDTLPKTQTKLFENFIIMTIIHFLKKDKKVSTATVASFNDLPPPYDQVVKELSQFAFLALQKDQLVFTSAEVKATDANLTPANWYGLGLLKHAKYFKPRGGYDHESFHFLHFSIQEYMAAYHIASLSDKVQLKLLNNTFWDVHYFNTWIMYFGITGGNRIVFNDFLSGSQLNMPTHLVRSTTISSEILNDKIKCLHLLHCSAEAENDVLLSVENIFQGGIIDLSHLSLSPNDIHTLAVLLLRSPNKQWKIINLSHCNIDDKCCNVLCEIFHSHAKHYEVKFVDLSYNNIQWESVGEISNICKTWNTKELILPIDSLYDRATMDMINTFSSKIRNAIPSDSVANLLDEKLFVTYMPEERKVIAVYVTEDCILCTQFTDCKLNDDMIEVIKENFNIIKMSNINFSVYSGKYTDIKLSTLAANIQSVKFCGSNLHSKGAYLLNDASIIDHQTNPLDVVADYIAAVSHNSQSCTSYLSAVPIKTAVWLKDVFKKVSSLRVFAIVNNNINDGAANDIAAVLLNTTELQVLGLSGNNLKATGAIKIAQALRTCETLTWLDISNNNISDEAADDIAAVLSHNTKLQMLGLGGNNLQTAGAIKIAKALQNTTTLTTFSITNNNISDEAADDIAAVLSHNTNLQVLYLGGNNLQTAGAIKIARALQNTTTLTQFDMENNNISDEAADDIAAVLSHNTKLQVLCLGGNNLQTVGAIKIARALQNTTTLTQFGMENNNISDEAADDIAAVLSHNTKLQVLCLGGNNLQTTGGIKIARALQNTTTLTQFSITNNNISDEAADDIAAVLSHNTKLQVLCLGGNNLQTAGAIKIARALQNTTALTTFSITNNNISDEATDDIAAVLSLNTKLQVLGLGENNLQTAGAIKIARALQNTTTLTQFGMENNNISDEAADDIAAVLSLNTKLQVLGLGGNNLQTAGAIKIARALQNTTTLTQFGMENNNISDEAADDIAAVLSHNTKLQELYLSGNNLQTAGAIKIAIALQNTTTLTKFSIINNNVSDEAADDIAAVLSHNTKLQELYLSGNNLQTAGAIKIARALQNTTALTTFSITNNNISDEAADDIAAVLSHNTKLQKLYLGGNNLQTAGAIKIARALQNTTTLTQFDMENNNISDEAADDIQLFYLIILNYKC